MVYLRNECVPVFVIEQVNPNVLETDDLEIADTAIHRALSQGRNVIVSAFCSLHSLYFWSIYRKKISLGIAVMNVTIESKENYKAVDNGVQVIEFFLLECTVSSSSLTLQERAPTELLQ